MAMQLYHSTDCRGVSEVCPDKNRMRKIIETLEHSEYDADHPDIALINDTCGWSISLYPSGIATMENLDADDANPLYMKNISRSKAFDLWCRLAEGRIEALLQLGWQKRTQ